MIRTFGSEAEVILYGLMTHRGMCEEHAMAVVRQWLDDCITVQWSLELNTVVIYITELGMAVREAHMEKEQGRKVQ